MARGRFKTHVEEAYRVVCERGLIDDGELQYLLDLSLTTYYRVRRALLAVYHDVEYEKGFLRLKRKQEGEPVVEYWGELEPSEA